MAGNDKNKQGTEGTTLQSDIAPGTNDETAVGCASEPKTQGNIEPDAGSAQGQTSGNEGNSATAGSTGEGITDKHGQPGINKERHEREVNELKKQIEELQAEVAQAAETKEGREKLEKQIEELKADMADKDITHKLEMAGCLNAKAAKALLDDYDGDVDKLKADATYLFDDGTKRKGGSTGKSPEGAPGGLEDDVLDRAFGLKK